MSGTEAGGLNRKAPIAIVQGARTSHAFGVLVDVSRSGARHHSKGLEQQSATAASARIPVDLIINPILHCREGAIDVGCNQDKHD